MWMTARIRSCLARETGDSFFRELCLSAVPTKATILLAKQKLTPTSPLAIRPPYSSSYVILHCLVNGQPHWATGYLVRQQAGL